MEVIHPDQLQPDILVGGLRIGEPVVSLTAVLMALVCLYAWFRLGAVGGADKLLRLYRLFFICMAVSGLIGGLLGHAFLYRFPFFVKMPGWISGIVAVACLGQVSIERLRQFKPDAPHRLWSAVNIGVALLALGVLCATRWFPIVEFHTAFGLLGVVGSIELGLWRRVNLRSSLFLLGSIPFAILAAGVHAVKFSLGPWFTFFDIGHLLVCGTFWMIYQSALLHEDRPRPITNNQLTNNHLTNNQLTN